MRPQEIEIKNVFKSLDEQIFFKLVCGASFDDVLIVENLVFLFTLAGADVIDLAPSADVIFAARRGIEKAFSCKLWNRELNVPLLMASIQLDKDPHFRKVVVDHNLCDLCGACIKVCPTEAFHIQATDFHLYSERCFGCGACPSVCHVNALTMKDVKLSPKETLEEMISLGIKSIEFHFGENYTVLENIWESISKLTNNLELISFSIGNESMKPSELKEAAKLFYKLSGKNIIIQCDGKSMSGGLKKSENNDLVCIEIAKQISEEKLPVYLQLAGGTNEYSLAKAKNNGVSVHGVAIGSYARKKLMPYLKCSNLLEDIHKVKEALSIASSMVNSVKMENDSN